ncbi:MAG: CoA transferase [Acidobacteria bacterium]|nr:CoA transferase [Acidobacteriota bacterium]MBK9706395.1 CoA transferase [Acidobacteriota bacterium]
MNLPLQGIRVLDFGRYIAGPYCSMLLGDFGAEVIRVERREGGEDRWVAPITEEGEGSTFIGINRNKKSMTLDPANPQSYEIKHRLVSRADVVLANLPQDVLLKLGLDYDSLKAIKPDIILTRISTFGHEGPYANRVGFDPVIQAMSGAMSLTGFPGAPVRSVVNFEDYGTALHAAFGTMVALFERERTGKGQIVDASLLSTGIAFMQSLLAERHVLDIARQQQGNTGYHAAPADAYRTKDGWVIIMAIGNYMFSRWAKLVGRPDLIDDPRCADDISRANNKDLITDAMNSWISVRTTEEAIRDLEEARVPCGPIYDLGAVFDDEQIKARGLFRYMDYPGSPKSVPVVNTPVQLSETPGGIRHRAPTLGEHTDEVLQESGFSEAEIMAFRNSGVI